MKYICIAELEKHVIICTKVKLLSTVPCGTYCSASWNKFRWILFEILSTFIHENTLEYIVQILVPLSLGLNELNIIFWHNLLLNPSLIIRIIKPLIIKWWHLKNQEHKSTHHISSIVRKEIVVNTMAVHALCNIRLFTVSWSASMCFSGDHISRNICATILYLAFAAVTLVGLLTYAILLWAGIVFNGVSRKIN